MLAYNVFGLCVVALSRNLKLTTTLNRAITQNPCYVPLNYQKKMGCEICGRGACTRSFHSLEEQEEFDRVNKTDEIKERLRNIIERQVNRLKGDYIEDDYYVKLSDVIDVIQSSD